MESFDKKLNSKIHSWIYSKIYQKDLLQKHFKRKY